MLGYLPQSTIGDEVGAPLEGARRLEQHLSGVQHDQQPAPRAGGHTGWPQRLQVDAEVALVEVGLVAPLRHLRDELPPSDGDGRVRLGVPH